MFWREGFLEEIEGVFFMERISGEEVEELGEMKVSWECVGDIVNVGGFGEWVVEWD